MTDTVRRSIAAVLAMVALVVVWRWPPLTVSGAAIMLPLTVLLSAAGVAFASRAWSAAAEWMALTIVGWAATLQLVNAPPAVAYQHLEVLAHGSVPTAARVILMAQFVMVLTFGREHIAAALRWCRKRLPLVTLLLPALFFFSGVPSRDPRVHLMELLVATVLQLLSLVCLLAAARSIPRDGAARTDAFLFRVLGPEGRGRPRLDRRALLLAAFVVAMTALLARVVYQNHPHVPDEVVYLLHARYLAQGLWTMPLPPVPAAFDLDLMQFEPTRWYSPVPPGWPFVLSIGVRLGIPWLVNPLLAGLSVVLAWLLLGRLTDHRQARLATLLLAASPWFLFMGMNLMTHTLTLVLALAAALGVAHAREGGRWLPGLLGGMCVGGASLVRPLEGLVLAVLLGFWSLGARGTRFRVAPSAALVAGTALVAGLVVPYNRLLTGSARVFPINEYVDTHYEPGANDLGFGANRGLGWGGLDPFPGHAPLDAAVNTVMNTSLVDTELLGWPVGAVPLVLLPLLLGSRRDRRLDWWMAACIAAVGGAHAFYWFSGGPDFGARYWYLIIVPCCVLIASGLSRLDLEVSEESQRSSARVVGVALALAALVVFVPWRSLGKYRNYRGMRPDVRALAQAEGFGRSIVLIRGARFPDYASAAVYNPVDLNAGVPVYAWDATDGIRDRVLAAYPDRTVWILDGPTLTGDGFRIAAGPLSPGEARTAAVRPDAGGRPPERDPVVTPPGRGDR